METMILLAVGWLVGWVCRSFLFWWERDCADPTHGPDGYVRAIDDAIDTVLGMIKCDHCEGCEALDYAVVELVALRPDIGVGDGCPDA